MRADRNTAEPIRKTVCSLLGVLMILFSLTCCVPGGQEPEPDTAPLTVYSGPDETALVPADTGEEDTATESTSAEETTSEETTAEATSAEATSAEATAAEETTFESTSAEETTSEETTAEATSAEATTAEETAAHVHAFGDWTTVKAASCETAGEQKRSCACGVTETRAVAATGHVRVSGANRPATCTESGLTSGAHCSVCGKILEAQTPTAPLGHTFGENNKCVRCGLTDPDLGTLLYYENFDKYSASTNSANVLNSLGWKADSPANGAYRGNTTAYSIVSVSGGKRLYLKNNTSSGSDSYVIVLPASLMGKYHESNYTYQYDVIYADASAADRYIALVSDYSGQTYNSFHFRNRGTANNQVHDRGSWYTYDSSGVNYAAGTNSNSIVTKLLGRTYSADTQAFKNISVSIRYVVDWQNGNSVYMRVNTAGYPGTGKWTLVSKYSKSGNANAYLDPDKFGGAIVLKTGGKQNGYVDNIIVWTGTGAEPYDKSSPKFRSTDKGCSGHRFAGGGTCLDPEKCIYCGELSANNNPHVFEPLGVEGNSDRRCSVCSALESNIGTRWKIAEIPSFDGGTASQNVYRSAQGPFKEDLPISDESEMMILSSVKEDDLSAYLSKLVSYGYREEYSAASDGNVYAGYYDGTRRVYAYYTDYSKQIRVIYDRTGDSIEGFGYTYEKQPGERTVVYQYGIPMSESGANGDGEMINCGMMYIVKLADGKLIVIDGGGYQQFDKAERDGLISFMREITGKESGRIDIAAWYITHCHNDHLAGFCLFLKQYCSDLSIERMIFNFPSVWTEDGVLSGQRSGYSKLIGYVNNYAPGVKYLKLHTGESLTLCDLTIHCLYTHEDLTDAKTGSTGIAADFNNSTTVSRLDFDGLRFMLLGDVNKPGMNVIIARNAASTLKCDILQLAHHVYNDLRTLYSIVGAEAVFVPQSEKGSVRTATMAAVMTAVRSYVSDPDNLLKYGASGTYGYAAGENGRPALVYSRDGVDGGPYTDWSW